MPELIATTVAFVASTGVEIAGIEIGTATILQTVAAVYTLRDQQRRAENRARDAYNAGLRDRYAMLRSSLEPRALVLGRQRVSGPVAYMGSYGSQHEHLVYTPVLSAHELDAVETVYFTDEPVLIDGTGNVVGIQRSDRFSISTPTTTVTLSSTPKAGTVTASATYGTTTVGLSVGTVTGTSVALSGAYAGQTGLLTVSYQPDPCPFVPNATASSTQGFTPGGTGTDIFTLATAPVAGTVTAVQTSGTGSDQVQTVLATSVSGSAVTVTGAVAGAAVVVSYQSTATLSRARVRAKLGAPGQVADAAMITNLPGVWTASHTGTGLGYLAVELDYDQTAFPSSYPGVSAVVRGLKCLDPRTGTTAWSDNPALMLRAYALHPLGANLRADQIDDDLIAAAATICDTPTGYVTVTQPAPSTAGTDADFASVVLLLHGDEAGGSSATVDSSSYGHARQAVSGTDTPLSVATTTAPKYGSGCMLLDSSTKGPRYLGSEFDTTGRDHTFEAWVRIDTWGFNHCIACYGDQGGAGSNKLVVIVEDAFKKFEFWGFNASAGIYNFALLGTTTVTLGTWYHVAVRALGSTRELWVNGTLEATGTHTGAVPTLSSPAFFVGRGQGSYTMRGALDEVRFTNGLARTISLPTGPYPEGAALPWTSTVMRPLYTAGMVAKSGVRPADVFTDLCQAMGGRWCIVDGKLKIKAGAYTAPVMALDETWLHEGGNLQVQPGPNRSDVINAITGTFADEANAYKVTQFPKVAPDAYIAQDGGAELPTDVPMPAVTNAAQAQYIAACKLRYQRQGLTIKLTCNMRAYQCEPFDVITVSLARMGWVRKPAEVLDVAWTLEGGIELTLKKIDPSIWAMDAPFSAVDPAPNTRLPNPWGIPQVAGLSAVSNASTVQKQADGSKNSRILAGWTAVADQRVTQNGQVELRWGRATDPETSWESVLIPGNLTSTYLAPVHTGSSYLLKARTVTPGAASDWCSHVLCAVLNTEASGISTITNAITYSPTAPTSPVNGDWWIDTSTTPQVAKARVAGSWVLASTLTTNTNQLTDGAGLGLSAAWSGVSGTGKPADNATVNRITYSPTSPSSPVDGDWWADTSGTPVVVKLRVSGAWQVGANLSTGALAQLNAVDTAQIVAGAATAVAVATVASYTCTHDSHVPDGEVWRDASISVTYTATVSCDAVVSVTGQWDYTTAGSAGTNYLALRGGINISGSWAATNDTVDAFEAGVSGIAFNRRGDIGTSKRFAVTAGTTYTFVLLTKVWNSYGGDVVTLNNLEMRLEVIKR